MKKLVILSILGFILLGLFSFVSNSEAVSEIKKLDNNSTSNSYSYEELLKMGAIPVQKDSTFDPSKYGATPSSSNTTSRFDFTKYGGVRVTPPDEAKGKTSESISIYIWSALNIIIKIGGIVLLLFLLYKVIIPVFYKPNYIKNKKNTAWFIVAGLIACIAVSLFFGMDNTPPCLEREYDTRGSYCVEYDDTVAPLNYKDKMGFSGKIFGVTFPTFLYFVYKKKKEQDNS